MGSRFLGCLPPYFWWRFDPVSVLMGSFCQWSGYFFFFFLVSFFFFFSSSVVVDSPGAFIFFLIRMSFLFLCIWFTCIFISFLFFFLIVFVVDRAALLTHPAKRIRNLLKDLPLVTPLLSMMSCERNRFRICYCPMAGQFEKMLACLYGTFPQFYRPVWLLFDHSLADNVGRGYNYIVTRTLRSIGQGCCTWYCVCVCVCVCVCERERERVCVTVKRPTLPPCVVEGRSRTESSLLLCWRRRRRRKQQLKLHYSGKGYHYWRTALMTTGNNNNNCDNKGEG